MYFEQLQERLLQLLYRIQGYPLHEVFIELALVWVVVYFALRFLRGTRGANVIKGMALLLVVATVTIKLFSSENQFERANFLYSQFVTFAAITLIIVFQPELRRGLVRIGEARLFRGTTKKRRNVVDEIIASVGYLHRNKIGGLIVIEREVGLEGVVEAGTQVDAVVTEELLNTIFWPGSALHDMAVVIRDDRIRAAGVQLPLAEGDQISTELGSRHRAAIGLSQESDALILVVSEETGKISVAQRGQLTRDMSLDALRDLLEEDAGQRKTPPIGDAPEASIKYASGAAPSPPPGKSGASGGTETKKAKAAAGSGAPAPADG